MGASRIFPTRLGLGTSRSWDASMTHVSSTIFNNLHTLATEELHRSLASSECKKKNTMLQAPRMIEIL
jgi:hypothetical protein